MVSKEEIKEHFERHKIKYLVATSCIVTAGITAIIMRERYAVLQRGADTAENSVFVRSDAKPTYLAHQPLKSSPTEHSGFSFSNSDVSNSFNNIVNVVEREGSGHPGYMVKCLETNLTYPSQKEAALTYGIHPNRMSDHLNGRLAHVDGNHFERIHMAA